MSTNKMYEIAKEMYAKIGVDTDAVIAKLKNVPVSIQCWQGDDVKGFESQGPLTGGIQTTGNYLGKANNFEELTKDLDIALKYIPGKKKINLHASYQSNDVVDRKDITINQFRDWVNFAKERNLFVLKEY